MRWALFLLIAMAQPAAADSLVATRTLRAHSVLQPEDVARVTDDITGAAADIDAVVGLETNVALYAGSAIRLGDLSAPALVERNQIVKLAFTTGTLTIFADGRALARGAEGEVIRVMNATTRVTLTGRIGPDGTVFVTP